MIDDHLTLSEWITSSVDEKREKGPSHYYYNYYLLSQGVSLALVFENAMKSDEVEVLAFCRKWAENLIKK